MRTILLALCFVSSFSFAGETYECRKGEMVRTISVTQLYVEDKVPCEVRYQNAEGEKVLWSAQKEVGYCESKAKAFVAKQEAWGWACHLLATE